MIAGEVTMSNEITKIDPITPMAMLQLAVEKGAAADQIEKLMDLHMRWEADQARKAFVAAMAAFKASAPKLTKNKHVSFPSKGGHTDYDHATLDAICATLDPPLTANGFVYDWETDQAENGMVRVTCIITHGQGHEKRTTLAAMPDNSGGKNLVQAIGSTVTYLQRYTLLSGLGLATADADDDGRAGGGAATITAEQKQQIIALMQEVGADTMKFLKYLKVETLDDLLAAHFDGTMKALEIKRSKA